MRPSTLFVVVVQSAVIAACAAPPPTPAQHLVSMAADGADGLREQARTVPSAERQDALGRALCVAAKNGRTNACSVLMKLGASVAHRFEGATALMWSAARGHVASTRLLLDAGADVHDAEFVWRVKQGSQDHVEAEKFAERIRVHPGYLQHYDRFATCVVEAEECGRDALALAVAGGHAEVARLLIAHGSNPDRVVTSVRGGVFGISVYGIIAAAEHYRGSFELQWDAGRFIVSPDGEGASMLLEALGPMVTGASDVQSIKGTMSGDVLFLEVFRWAGRRDVTSYDHARRSQLRAAPSPMWFELSTKRFTGVGLELEETRRSIRNLALAKQNAAVIEAIGG